MKVCEVQVADCDGEISEPAVSRKSVATISGGDAINGGV